MAVPASCHLCYLGRFLSVVLCIVCSSGFGMTAAGCCVSAKANYLHVSSTFDFNLNTGVGMSLLMIIALLITSNFYTITSQS